MIYVFRISISNLTLPTAKVCFWGNFGCWFHFINFIFLASNSNSSRHYKVFHVSASDLDGVNLTESYSSALGPNISMTPTTIIYGLRTDYKGCATSRIQAFKRLIIAIALCAILCTLIQLFLDMVGTKQRHLKSIRAYALGNIVTVLSCIVILALCYFVTILYERVQLHHLLAKLHHEQTNENSELGEQLPKPQPNFGSTHDFDYLAYHGVLIRFEVSYYLITFAGLLSVFAAASHLFRKPRFVFVDQNNELNMPTSTMPATYVSTDENALLSSDMLNTEVSNSYHASASHPHHHRTNQSTFTPMNHWMLTTVFNGSTDDNADDVSPNSDTNANTPPSYVPSVPNRCPPPPPYTP